MNQYLLIKIQIKIMIKILTLFFLITLISAGCDDTSTETQDVQTDSEAPDSLDQSPDDTLTDSEPDIIEDTTHEKTLPSDNITPEGQGNLLDPVEPGKVEAGMISEFPTGFGGNTHCRIGDYKLKNSQVQFCISGHTPILHYLFDGGHVIDGEPVHAPDQPGTDQFLMAAPLISFATANAEEIEIIRDGSDSDIAVVRVTGRHERVAIFEVFIPGFLNMNKNSDIITEYRLSPDVNYLEIVTWITNHGDLYWSVTFGDLVFFGDKCETFYPGYGADYPPSSALLPYAAGISDKISYAWTDEREDGLTLLPLDIPGLRFNASPVSTPQIGLASGHSVSFLRRLIITDGPTTEFTKTIAEINNTEWNAYPVTINVINETTETPVPQARLTIFKDELPRDQALTDDEGRVQIDLEPGNYEVKAALPYNAGGPTSFEVSSEGAEVILPILNPGLLSFDISSAEGDSVTASPAKVELFGDTDYRLFIKRGQKTFAVTPGTYQMMISRGFEWTAIQESITVEAGEQLDLIYTLDRVLDTTGKISADFHQHSTFSIDSTVTAEDRILSNLVEGVDFIAPSDHDYVSNFMPTIIEMGIEDLIFSIRGTEVSPPFGHFNMFPPIADPTLPGNGANLLNYLEPDGELHNRTAPELFAHGREVMGVEIIQVNHPRGSSGYLKNIDYLPSTGLPQSHEENFSLDFNSIEVVNGTSSTCLVSQDWYSFLNQGIIVSGMGNSDTHSLGTEAGYPRNYLPSAATRSDEITEDEIISAVREGRVVVSGGAYIDFPEGDLVGEVIQPDSSGEVTFRVRVQTPPWAKVTELLLIYNGIVIQEFSFSPDTEDIIDFEETITFTPDQDGWFHLWTYGDETMPVVSRGSWVWGFTNPTWIDLDGDIDQDGEPVEPPGAHETPILQLPFCN